MARGDSQRAAALLGSRRTSRGLPIPRFLPRDVIYMSDALPRRTPPERAGCQGVDGHLVSTAADVKSSGMFKGLTSGLYLLRLPPRRHLASPGSFPPNGRISPRLLGWGNVPYSPTLQRVGEPTGRAHL